MQIGEEKIEEQTGIVQISVMGKGSDIWVAENLKTGSSIIDNKGRILAKVLRVSSSPSASVGTLIRDANTNKSLITFDSNERDVEATVELMVTRVNNNYYFGGSQKVKVGEQINLPFKEVNLSAPITSIKEIQ